jgi:hypothetical protein
MIDTHTGQTKVCSREDNLLEEVRLVGDIPRVRWRKGDCKGEDEGPGDTDCLESRKLMLDDAAHLNTKKPIKFWQRAGLPSREAAQSGDIEANQRQRMV